EGTGGARLRGPVHTCVEQDVRQHDPGAAAAKELMAVRVSQEVLSGGRPLAALAASPGCVVGSSRGAGGGCCCVGLEVLLLRCAGSGGGRREVETPAAARTNEVNSEREI
ncbi:hypothetical protein Agub_g15405, partial [Astrephomene gubernaculifera]